LAYSHARGYCCLRQPPDAPKCHQFVQEVVTILGILVRCTELRILLGLLQVGTELVLELI
jgi:hypothetical protein